MTHRNRLAKGVVKLLAAAAATVPALSGCIPTQGTDFRTAALPSIQNGVNMILDGLVDGVFAALSVEPDANDN